MLRQSRLLLAVVLLTLGVMANTAFAGGQQAAAAPQLNLDQAIDYLALVKAYEALHNAYNVDAVMAMFAPEATFELVGQGTLTDLDTIRAIHAYDKGIRSQLAFVNCTVSGTVVTCETIEHNRWLATAGIDPYYYPTSIFTFTEDGLIRKISATLSAESARATDAVLASFGPWLQTERAEASAPLFGPEGQFLYSEENGYLVLELLQQWRQWQQQSQRQP